MKDRLEVWGVGTARTIRVHWALQELKVPHTVQPVQSRSGETQTPDFLALNPRGKIPVLQHGDLRLAESAAIVSYLGDRFGEGSKLVPTPGTRERAIYEQWAFFIMTELDAHTLYIRRRHGDLSSLYGEAPEALVAAKSYFHRQAGVAADEIEAGGPFLLGEFFTGVDILLASCLDWAVFYGDELDPRLVAYQERTHDRESYAAAMAVNFPPEVLAALRAQAQA